MLDKGKNNVYELLSLGEYLFKEGQFLGSLKVFNVALKLQPTEVIFYEKASKAFAEYLLACNLPDTECSNLDFRKIIKHNNFNIEYDFNKAFNKEELLIQLILQDACLNQSAQFFHILFVYSLLVQSDFKTKLFKEISPAIRKIYTERRINKNLVLMLIFLRDILTANTSYISDKDISYLHTKYFSSFSVKDFEFYNFLFQKFDRGQQKNKQDLRKLATNISPHLLDATSKFELYHLLFLSWLNENLASCLHDTEILSEILNVKLCDSKMFLNESQVKAGRLLLLRYLNKDVDLDKISFELSPLFDSLSFPDGFLKKLEETRLLRTSICQSEIHQNNIFLRKLVQNRMYRRLNKLKHLWQTKVVNFRVSSNKLRIAICVSGQLRGFCRAFATWRNTLLTNTEYDIFVHTWTKIGRRLPDHVLPYRTFSGEFLQAYRECFAELGTSTMSHNNYLLTYYPSLFNYFNNSTYTTKNNLTEVYGTDHVVVEDEDEERFKGFSNSDKMYYKIHACHQYMLNQGKEYDLIIRIRPDKAISSVHFNWQDIYRLCKSDTLILADQALDIHRGSLGVGDQFAIGNINTMSIYSDTWKYNTIASNQDLLNWSRNLTGHWSLAYTCWIHGISFEEFPVGWGRLWDPEPLKVDIILEKIKLDASNRMNKVDKRLISALEADLA